MDLRLLSAEPTEAERDAVDALLGPSLHVWTGEGSGHSAHGGHAARAQRHLLLPTLHALHERAGWISPGGLNYVARQLTVPPADVYGVATFYALFSVTQRPQRVVHVCDDVVCRCAGSEELIAQLGPEGDDVDGATWLRSHDAPPTSLSSGPKRSVSCAMRSSEPAQRHAMSSQTCTTRGGRSSTENSA